MDSLVSVKAVRCASPVLPVVQPPGCIMAQGTCLDLRGRTESSRFAQLEPKLEHHRCPQRSDKDFIRGYVATIDH